MRNLTYCILGLLLFIGCNSTPLKEYSDNDVEYNEKTNTWIQKSDGSIIKESFVINDELFDGVNPHRRVVKIDENGHVITSTLYRGNTLLQKGDLVFRSRGMDSTAAIMDINSNNVISIYFIW